MLRSAHNVQVAAALVAVARAHMRMPGFDVAKAKDIAVKIDRACLDDRSMEVTFALCACVLRAIGVTDVNDSSLFH